MGLRIGVFRSVGTILLVLALGIAWESSGPKEYPGGASAIVVSGPALDPSYRADRWYSLYVGYHSRTSAPAALARAFTAADAYRLRTKAVSVENVLGRKNEQLEERDKSIQRATSSARLRTGVTGVQVEYGMPGGSAGLALALALIDGSTPGDLTAGRRIAATGQLAGETVAAVVQVRGLEEKLESATWVNADVVLAPLVGDAGAFPTVEAHEILDKTPVARSRLLSRPGPLVVRVRTLDEAMMVLVALGGEAEWTAPPRVESPLYLEVLTRLFK